MRQPCYLCHELLPSDDLVSLPLEEGDEVKVCLPCWREVPKCKDCGCMLAEEEDLCENCNNPDLLLPLS